MNSERLKQVRDAIASDPDQYDQGYYVNECGSPACVAGWAAHLSLEPGEALGWWGLRMPDGRYRNPHLRAQMWLGLSSHDAGRMFDETPLWVNREDRSIYDEPTVQEALAMLDHAIETGEVVWKRLPTGEESV